MRREGEGLIVDDQLSSAFVRLVDAVLVELRLKYAARACMQTMETTADERKFAFAAAGRHAR